MAYALILAGGTGTRMGKSIPKQFLDLCGVPVILRTVRAFARCEEIDGIYLVCHPDYRDELCEILSRGEIEKPVKVVNGGESRQRSAYLGLTAMKDHCPDDAIVLIHDGARPLISTDAILRCIRTTAACGAANTVYPSENTMLISPDGAYGTEYPARSTCFTVQTPQGFHLGEILSAHEAYGALADPFPVTDDCGLYAAITGKQPRLCLGDKGNIKITTPMDLVFGRAILESGKEEE